MSNSGPVRPVYSGIYGYLAIGCGGYIYANNVIALTAVWLDASQRWYSKGIYPLPRTAQNVVNNLPLSLAVEDDANVPM